MNNTTITTPLYKAGLHFDHHYLEHKSYFMSLHNCIPNLSSIYPIDGTRALAAFCSRYAAGIAEKHTCQWFEPRKKKYNLSRVILRMKDPVTLEFTDNSCEILHDGSCDALIAEFTGLLQNHLERQKRTPREINLIVRGDGGLELRAMEIKRSRLDLDLYYDDDFAEIDATIRSRLTKKNDKGIILLHGLPGTGKTTYLRHLVGSVKRRVLFLSPTVGGDLMDPTFIQLLIDHPNSVIIIEDAENIIMDRRLGSSSSVSNLLNISDGLLADFLNVQLICTFNSSLTMVDSALMRKGRLIAKYAFGKLPAEKAQRLSDHAGFSRIITEPMTLAEVMNPHERDHTADRMEVIGFRRTVFENQ